MNISEVANFHKHGMPPQYISHAKIINKMYTPKVHRCVTLTIGTIEEGDRTIARGSALSSGAEELDP